MKVDGGASTGEIVETLLVFFSRLPIVANRIKRTMGKFVLLGRRMIERKIYKVKVKLTYAEAFGKFVAVDKVGKILQEVVREVMRDAGDYNMKVLAK